ncbi:MAG: type II toxin-antitoxin system HicB family antitoxin [Bacteroidetes bacterium]|nr:MAG: type II toxin-antitoxin system HicB family antitoxin [Bacteroidota bacterium]
MDTTKYVYWKEEEIWLGYLEEYPDYMSQGASLDELRENLKDIYLDITHGHIPNVRKVAELEIA